MIFSGGGGRLKGSLERLDIKKLVCKQKPHEIMSGCVMFTRGTKVICH